LQALHETLKVRLPKVWVTKLLITINLLVFVAMLANGAGLWHSVNGVQLDWGANFGPATQDGEWWRLGSAIFLHFGIAHLALNMWSLWDIGQLTERMYGRVRFLGIYLISGLFGNLVSLVSQGNLAVSGGASGAIFGIYGALLVFLWLERTTFALVEFRWLFWGASGFATATIILGFIIPGIDNAAHIGGFIAGIISGCVFVQSKAKGMYPTRMSLGFALILVLLTVVLSKNIPPPKYRWSEEMLLRNKISEFIYQDQAINRTWLEIRQAGNQGGMSFDELAGKIDANISEPYEESFEKLSKLPANPAMPSANQLDNILKYIQQRKHESEMLAEGLRNQKGVIALQSKP
jgi:rhomboid protease GluP